MIARTGSMLTGNPAAQTQALQHVIACTTGSALPLLSLPTVAVRPPHGGGELELPVPVALQADVARTNLLDKHTQTHHNPHVKAGAVLSLQPWLNFIRHVSFLEHSHRLAQPAAPLLSHAPPLQLTTRGAPVLATSTDASGHTVLAHTPVSSLEKARRGGSGRPKCSCVAT